MMFMVPLCGDAPMSSSNLTYAQALNDAKALIVQQSARIKSDAQKIRQQAEEIAQWRSMADEMGAELERLRALEPQLAEAQAGREHAEATVGRQRMEIEQLESASRELQRILGEQAARINELGAELDQARGALPSEEDEAALEAMASLLSAARKPKKAEPPAAPVPAAEPQGPRMMVIPAEPTPFCEGAARQAA
jgi:predicted RNase H-like nuclease (RuvC/YqgF family)